MLWPARSFDVAASTDVRAATSDMGAATSDVGAATSDMGAATSDVGAATSDMGAATSDMGAATSDAFGGGCRSGIDGVMVNGTCNRSQRRGGNPSALCRVLPTQCRVREEDCVLCLAPHTPLTVVAVNSMSPSESSRR